MEDREKFDNWVDQWEKALKDGVFDNLPGKEDIKINNTITSKETFFGDLNINTNSEPSQEDVSYWNDVSRYSEDTILNESKKNKEEKIDNLIKVSKKVADNANPVNFETIGKDSNKPSKKGFASNESIEKLSDLKKKLHDLEKEMLSKEALGKDYKKVEKEMKKVYDIIDKLSDELNQSKFEIDSESKNK